MNLLIGRCLPSLLSSRELDLVLLIKLNLRDERQTLPSQLETMDSLIE